MRAEDRRIYRIWVNMRYRCNNPKCKDYPFYGGRGVKVCELWDKATSFIEWARNNGYNDTLSIDRINVDGDYEPSNCRWVDDTTQKRNRRTLKNNKCGMNGVSYDKERNKYEANIYVNNKRIRLGRFKTLEEAMEARKEGEKQYWSMA